MAGALGAICYGITLHSVLNGFFLISTLCSLVSQSSSSRRRLQWMFVVLESCLPKNPEMYHTTQTKDTHPGVIVASFECNHDS